MDINHKSPHSGNILTLDSMNVGIRAIDYPIRAKIFTRSYEIEREIEQGVQKPYKKVVRLLFGDLQGGGQCPMTFGRQVIALCSYPPLLDSPLFPEDAKLRARRILESCRNRTIGAYSDYPGIDTVRQDVADYITKRDGHTSNMKDIFMSQGTMDSIRLIMQTLISGEEKTRTGALIAIPMYPLYKSILAEFNGVAIPYYLDEETNWSLNIDELQRAVDEARQFCTPRIFVVINPGNPTGQILSRKNMEDIVKFAKKERLVILADEVYQFNVYSKDHEFISFKKVMKDLGGEYADMELASFLSLSKGFMGEAGFRNGYCELVNFDSEVREQLWIAMSSKQSPNVPGQILMSILTNPPQEGDPSYELYEKEKKQVLDELALKSRMITEAFNQIKGMQCNDVVGSMYAFPRIFLPDKAIQEAKVQGVPPDDLYCNELLEQTGICVIPGNGFGQKDGTYHFRIAILIPVDELKTCLETIKNFHLDFLARYS